MKFAYADPPYIGQARKHYGREEVDHEELLTRLVSDYPDGWALSCTSVSLPVLLQWCPQGTRIGAWVKPFCSFKPGVNPAYAWEPVLFYGGRKRTRQQKTIRDWCSVNITLRRGLSGAKPEAFCFWLFDVLHLELGDTLDDIFPGTNAVSHALTKWLSMEASKREEQRA